MGSRDADEQQAKRVAEDIYNTLRKHGFRLIWDDFIGPCLTKGRRIWFVCTILQDMKMADIETVLDDVPPVDPY